MHTDQNRATDKSIRLNRDNKPNQGGRALESIFNISAPLIRILKRSEDIRNEPISTDIGKTTVAGAF